VNAKTIKIELQKLANSLKAKDQSRFFKTGPGEYGAGDVFIGIKVPDLRKISKQYVNMNFEHVATLLKSKVHEHRQIALFIMVLKYKKSESDLEKEKIYSHYVNNIKYINNWDLVDCSAEHIVGEHLHASSKSYLKTLSKSSNLWSRRIAMLATFNFIKKCSFKTTLTLATSYLNDKEDLIHKASGWMLREVGNRDSKILEDYLNKYYQKMPRTMLRYAIEKLPESKRQAYLKSKI
jgi:3-methyladenine DNA glycosylase AlkD